MKNFLSKQREIIAVIAWIAVVCLLGYFAIFSLIKHINSSKDQIQEDQLKQKIASDHVSELPKIKQQYDSIEKNFENMDVLLDKQNAVILIERLENIANDVNAEIKIDVQENKDAKAVQSSVKKDQANNDLITQLPSTNYLRFKINLKGGYESIVKFVQTIEHFEYYSDIISMDIQDKQQSTGDNNGGVLDPFNRNKKELATGKVSDGNLDADLDIVFYAK